MPDRLSVPPSTMTETTAMQRVAEALNQLNQGDRLVFVLYEFEGLPGKQIADITGCPEATVWRKLHYARRTFRGALGIAEVEVANSR
jgi:RNA polymerase sigma factor (sigma-70 family)